MSNKIKLTIRIDPDDYDEMTLYTEERKQSINKYLNIALKNLNKYNRKIDESKEKYRNPEYLRILANIIEEKNKQDKEDPMDKIEEDIRNDLHKTNNN